MSDQENDDIANWAEGLTPEGAPGEVSAYMRKVLGDRGYEKAVENQDFYVATHLQRQGLINVLLVIVAFYGVVIGAVATVALVAFVIQIIFG